MLSRSLTLEAADPVRARDQPQDRENARERGLSWTTDRVVAEKFARGQRCINSHPTLARGPDSKQHIFAVFLDRKKARSFSIHAGFVSFKSSQSRRRNRGDQAVAVVLDLVNPLRSLGRPGESAL
jgi:hypothetical protein